MKGELPEGTFFQLRGEGCWATLILKERRLLQGRYRKFSESWYWKVGTVGGSDLAEGVASSLSVAKRDVREKFNVTVCGLNPALTANAVSREVLHRRLKKVRFERIV